MGFRTLEISRAAEIHIKEGHARQSKLMHAQVNTAHEKYMELWIQIIKQKISNQSRALSIMGLEGAERIAEYVASVNEDSINSRLNYGYAVVRSAIARKLVATGFHQNRKEEN